MIARKYISVLLVIALAACGKTEPEKKTLQSITLKPETATLSIGETEQLAVVPTPADVEAVVSWSSSDRSVVTVDNSGLVTAVSEGQAVVTATTGKLNAEAKITVEGDIPPIPTPEGKGFYDPRKALSAKLTADIIFSKGAQLYKKGNIMQGFDFTDGGDMYYSQSPATTILQYICHASGPSSNSKDYMTLERFGHMTQIVSEKSSDGKTYIWCNSNGQSNSDGYGDNLSFCRIEYKEGTRLIGGYAGENFILSTKHSSGKVFYDLQVSIDFTGRRLLVGCRVAGVSARFHFVYDLDDVLALPERDVTLTVRYGTNTDIKDDYTAETKDTRTFKARDLADAKLLGYFEVPRGTTADQTYYYSHQGHHVHGDFVWFYEGNVVNNVSYAFITVYDYKGNVVVPRTEVKALRDNKAFINTGFTYDGYAEGESMKILDGRLYLGFACHSSASSSNRIQNILVYDLTK